MGALQQGDRAGQLVLLLPSLLASGLSSQAPRLCLSLWRRPSLDGHMVFSLKIKVSTLPQLWVGRMLNRVGTLRLVRVYPS